MSKRLKFIVFPLLITVVILALLFFLAPYIISPKPFIRPILSKIEEQGGPHIDIQGDMSMTLYPMLGVEVHKINITHPKLFGNKPLLNAESAVISVNLSKLLHHKEVQIKTLSIHSAHLNLYPNRYGNYAWMDMGPEPEAVAEKPKPQAKRRSQDKPVELTKLLLQDVNITYSDARKQLATMQHATVRADKLQLGAKPQGNIQVNIAKMQWDTLHISDLQAKVKIQDEIVSIEPLSAAVYGGTLQAQTKLDMRKQPFAWQAKEHIDNASTQIIFDLLASDLAGQVYKPRNHLPITGTLSGDSELRGVLGDNLIKQLKGHLALTVTGGRLNGFKGAQLIEQGLDLIQQKTSSVPVDDTQFARLAGRFEINNGVARNDDLVLEAQTLGITGQGTIDVVRGTIDYRLIGKRTQGGGVLAKYGIPINVKGTFDHVQATLDSKALVKQQLNGRKDQIKKLFNKQLRKLF